jgi:hypothetical protein
MAIRIPMINRKTGISKEGFIGFSWTYLFFGFWVPLLRGHYVMTGIHFLIFLAGVLTFTWWVVQIVLAFFFNKFYTLRLIEEGYDFVEPDSELANIARTILGIVRQN